MLHRKIRVNDSFDVSKVVTLTQDKKEDKEHGKQPKRFKYVELEALLNEDESQTQKQLAEQLSVSQQDVSTATRDGKGSKDRQMGTT